MREIIFLRTNYFMGHFKGYSKGAKTFFFLSPKLSRAQGGTLKDAKARDFGPWFLGQRHKSCVLYILGFNYSCLHSFLLV
jgi:hypothetical protein